MAQYRLYEATTMPLASASDSTPITVGLQFTVSATVTLRAILWWQATTGSSPEDRTVGIYKTIDGETGVLQGPIQTQAVSGTGWQTVTLDTPVVLEPGSYIAAVYHPLGQYSAIGGYYDTAGDGYGGGAGITTNEINVPSLATALHGKQNAYIYSAYFSFPNEQFGGGMYGVDILIDNAPIVPTPDVHVYDGTTWRGGYLYVYDGTDWVSSEPAP